MSACNYNPGATKDDGSCNQAKDGFDCTGKQLTADVNGATFFIRTLVPTPLLKSLSHAEVDLPENFEVGFEITPNKTPAQTWTNIIHFTATGKVFVHSCTTAFSVLYVDHEISSDSMSLPTFDVERSEYEHSNDYGMHECLLL